MTNLNRSILLCHRLVLAVLLSFISICHKVIRYSKLTTYYFISLSKKCFGVGGWGVGEILMDFISTPSYQVIFLSITCNICLKTRKHIIPIDFFPVYVLIKTLSTIIIINLSNQHCMWNLKCHATF